MGTDRSIVCGLIVVSCLGCASIRGSAPSHGVIGSAGLASVGAARIDLTPSPGFPMGGYSLAGEVAKGIWTHLFARVLLIEDGAGQRLAIVATDLWQIPDGLVDRVAEKVAERRPLAPTVGRSQILLSASHSHHSPGSFSTDPFFSAFAQSKAGFSRDLFEFLAHRIVDGILQAESSMRPAFLSISRTTADGLFRNRSLPAFRANGPPADALIQQNGALSSCTHPGYEADACRAVDPIVKVLRARGRGGVLIAAVVFLAAHPTALSDKFEYYSSDVFGATAHLVETDSAWARQAKPPVVALVNGAQGDVSLRWRSRTRADVLRLARLLQQSVMSGLTAPGSAIPLSGIDGEQISVRTSRIPLARQCPVGSPHCTAWFGRPGRATAAGAEDGRSGILPRHVSEPSPRLFPVGAHGYKPSVLGVDLLVLPFLQPSRFANLGIYELGSELLIALPGEFTTFAGRTIRNAVSNAAVVRLDHTTALGLTGGYIYYVATPEEYDLQHYEGSGTLFGRATLPTLVQGYRFLVSQRGQPFPAHQHDFDHRVIFETSIELPRVDLGPRPAIPPELAPGPGEYRAIGPMCWEDSIVPLLPVSGLRVVPRVTVDEQISGNWVPVKRPSGADESDEGSNFFTLVTKIDERKACWCTFWLPPRTANAANLHRIRVESLAYGASAPLFGPPTQPH